MASLHSASVERVTDDGSRGMVYRPCRGQIQTVIGGMEKNKVPYRKLRRLGADRSEGRPMVGIEAISRPCVSERQWSRSRTPTR